MTATYALALLTAREASVEFTHACDQYLNGVIDDAAYVAARNAYRASRREFHRAHREMSE